MLRGKKGLICGIFFSCTRLGGITNGSLLVRGGCREQVNRQGSYHAFLMFAKVTIS